MKQYWKVTMRGRGGYTCETGVGDGNAGDVSEACALAAHMFPEMVVVGAELATLPTANSQDEPNELPG